MLKEFLKAKLYIIIAVAVVVVIVAFLLIKNPFEWNLNVLGGDMKIDKTENVVEEVKKISELTTMCYYEESVVKKTKQEASMMNSVSKALNLGGDYYNRELVLITKGKVRAGFDLSKIKESDIKVSADTLNVTLPKPEILDVISNPSDCQVYHEDGDWSHEEVVKVEESVASHLKESALKDGILEKASEAGIKKLKVIFNTFGFKTVIINVADK